MASPLDVAVTAVAGQLSDLAGRITALERNQRSGYNPQNTSVSGSITITDQIGNPAVVIGQQSDGTFTSKQVGTIVPPKAPSTPLIAPGIQGLYVAWDGLMADGSTPAADFAALQVYVSSSAGFTPGPSTLAGHMVGAGLFGVGNLTPGTTYYVVLLAINGVGDSGDPSAQSSGVPVDVPAGTIPDGSITALKIATGTITAAQIAAAAGILGSQIATGSITSANILAGTITAALLAAGIIVAGIVDATTITGSILQNSTTDPRTSINADGSITITANSGIVIFKIGSDGTVYWYSPGGTLLMQLSPGGNQLIYASLTGPAGWNFEPPGPPAVLFSASSAVSSATYANAPTVNAAAGSCVTVIASASGATNVTGVADSQGNIYTQIQAQVSGVNMSVWQAQGINPLSSHDSITVTFGAANTQEKNIIALVTTGVVTTSVTDFSASANGTSTSPSTSGTPSFYGDALLFIVSNASAGGAPSAISDGWSQIAQQNVATFQWTTAWYSSNVSGLSQSATATIASAAWSAVMIGLKMSPLTPVGPASPAGVAATLAQSTAWSNDGLNSLKITHVGTTTGWGATFPAFPVQAGSTTSMQAVIMTPTALASVSIGFTFWSGAGGTGTNLGSVSGDQGTLATTTNGIYVVSISGATVPAGAVSATFFVSEGAGDPNGTIFYIDSVQVPGGLVYSNSPTGGTDPFGNPFEQGINFVGLPGLTSVFGVQDPFGNQVMAIDAEGNIQGQTISAATDLLIAGASVNAILGGASSGVVTRGWAPQASTSLPWPATAIAAAAGEVALLELDVTIPAGRSYLIQVFPSSFIPTIAANTQIVHRLRYTTDGSTPTTASTQADGHSPAVSALASGLTGLNFTSPYMEFIPPTPSVDTLYRFLLTGNIQAGSYKYQEMIEMRVTDNSVDSGQFNNNAVILGTGTSGGGGGGQNHTEYFYGNTTWSYYGPTPQLRNKNGTLYHGAYQGEAGYQFGYIQFSLGNLGNPLNTVLNYNVSKVQLRLLNQHSWYNTGMVLGFHSSTTLGTAGYSTLLQQWTINEGQKLTQELTTTAWNPFKAGGVTYAVLAPTAAAQHNLFWYGYFWGGGSNNANVPAMIVTYQH